MKFKIVIGDLLEQDAEAIVIPAVPHSGPTSRHGRAIYQAAGYDELLQARREFGRLSDGEAAITSGFALNAKYVIHVYTPEWFGGISGEPKYLTRCYCNALKSAAKAGIKSVAFPLLGTGTNRVPPAIALRIAEDAINGYIMAHLLNVAAYLVIHPSIKKELSALLSDTFDSGGTMAQLNPCCMQERTASDRFYAYIKRISHPSRLAEAIGCSPSTITRILNREGKSVPHKITVLLIAIGLGLSKEERHDFLNSVYAPYPFDARDRRLEELLEMGYTNIAMINSLLAEDDPDWILMHRSKGDRPAEQGR